MSARLLVSFLALFAIGSAPGTAWAGAAGTTSVGGRLVIPVDEDAAVFDGDDEGDVTVKGGIGLALSNAPTGRLRDRLIRAARSGNLATRPAAASIQAPGQGSAGGHAGNVQVNDPALDHVTTFDPRIVVTRPFEFATESETSAVRNGRHVVVGYNSSAGARVEFIPGLGLAFTQLKFSGFSVSHDGGRTFASGFVPAVNDAVAPFTFGDPALAIDRRGNIFYASLGVDAEGGAGRPGSRRPSSLQGRGGPIKATGRSPAPDPIRGRTVRRPTRTTARA
jgi:hypothetical protein